MHARAVRARPCAAHRARAIPSPYLSVRACIKGVPQPVAFCPCQRLLSASGKAPPSRLASVPATSSMPSHHTHFLSSCACPGASPVLEAASQATGPPPSPPESRHTVAALVSFCLDVVPLPRFVSRANTLPRRRTVAHGCAPWTPSCRLANHCPAPPALRCVLYASPPRLGSRRTRPMRLVGSDVGHPHAALWAMPRCN
jgi:hypothetical protein